MLDGHGLFPNSAGIFLFATASRPAVGLPQHSGEWLPGSKRRELVCKHLAPSGSEVKAVWSCL